MRRTVATAAFVVLLGFLTNIAVAWAFCLGVFGPNVVTPLLFDHGAWDGSVMEGTGVTSLSYSGAPTGGLIRMATSPVSITTARSDFPPGPRSKMRRARWGNYEAEIDPPYWAPYIDNEPLAHSVIASYAAGWPFRCVRDLSTQVRTGPLPFWNFEDHGAFVGDNPVRITNTTEPQTPRSLPYTPIWPGLLANTFAYAVAWSLFIPLGYSLRRLAHRRRIKKNRCPKCKYDLRDSTDICPECGWTKDTRIRFIGPLIAPLYVAVSFVLAFTLVGAVVVMISRRVPISEIIHAAYVGNSEVVELELQRDFTLLYTPQTIPVDTRVWPQSERLVPLEAAILGNQPEIVQLLLKHGDSPDALLPCGMSPIELAADWGRTDVVETLLHAGAHPCRNNNQCERLLANAVSRNDIRLYELLFNAGVPMSTWPMARATWEHRRYLRFYHPPSQYKAMIEYLVGRGDVTIPVTALYNLVLMNDVELLELLLEHGGDASAYFHETPLLCAAGQQGMDAEVAALLLEHGANPDAMKHNGVSPLQLAIMHDKPEVVRVLLEHGANPVLIDDDGRQFITPEIQVILDTAVENE